MKLKRTLPSVIEKLKEKKQNNIIQQKINKSEHIISMRPLSHISHSSHIDQINEQQQQVQEAKLIEKYLKTKPKIFTNPHLVSQNILLGSLPQLNLKKFSSVQRKSIFKKTSLDEACYIQPQNQNPLLQKLQKLQDLVHDLQNKVTYREVEESEMKVINKIKQLQSRQKMKEKELHLLSLELEKYKRCEKISRENELLYAKLVKKLKLNSSREQKISSINKKHHAKKLTMNTFSDYESLEEDYSGEENEIYSPFCLRGQKTLESKISFG